MHYTGSEVDSDIEIQWILLQVCINKIEKIWTVE